MTWFSGRDHPTARILAEELASIPIQARCAVPQVALEPAEHVDYGALEGKTMGKSWKNTLKSQATSHES